MGHSQAQKAEAHERIVKAAAARFREAGLNGVGVASLMAEAGLTHGGFYNHFASRDALVVEALERAFADDERRFARAAGQAGEPTFASLIEAYLRPSHRDEPARGCAAAALASEVARSDVKVKNVLTRRLRRYRNRLAALLPGGREKARRDALAAMSTMMGALMLSRAVDDLELSGEILDAAPHLLLARAD